MISRGASLVVWAIFGASLLGGQIIALASRGRQPGLGTFVGHLSSTRAGRGLVLLGWMWLGWHAFAR